MTGFGVRKSSRRCQVRLFQLGRLTNWSLKSCPSFSALNLGHHLLAHSNSTHTFPATNLFNSPLGGVTHPDPETLPTSPQFLLPSPPGQGSGRLGDAEPTGNSSLPVRGCRVLYISRTILPREPSGRGWVYHLTRTLERQWRRPRCAHAVL